MASTTDPGPSAQYYRRFPAGADGPIRPPSPPREPLLLPNETDREFLDAQAADGLYAILNLSRDASLSEIKERYRTLASMYHPDKQPDEARRRAATGRFQEIQRAHEVLTDPARRTVYDMFGEEGLRTSWEVGPRNMTEGQMKRHFQRQGDVKRKLDAEQLVNSKGDINLTLDARGVFLPRSAFDKPHLVDHSPLARAQRLDVGQVMMKHSFETPLSDRTQVVVEGTMAAMNRQGGANLSGIVRHQFSPRFWAQFSQSVLFPRITTAKATYTHDEMTFLTVNAVSQDWTSPPRMTFTLGRSLWPTTTGFINYSTGFFSIGSWGADIPDQMAMQDQSAMSIGLTNASGNGRGWTVEASAGLTATSLSADWSTFVMGLKLKLGTGFDFMEGLNAFADATAKVTETTKVGAMLKLATSGVRLVFHFGRVGQRVNIPILLSFDLNPQVVFWSTVLPVSAWAGFYHYWIVPRKQKRIERRIRRLRRDHAAFIAQKRQEAADATLLMERSVQQRADAERAKNGLVILDAHYGRASAFTSTGWKDEVGEDGEPVVVDVTVPVQALVAGSKLYIPHGPAKYNLLGFWDPCIGENKRLRVRYLFQGKVHSVEVDDVSALRAPVKAHALE